MKRIPDSIRHVILSLYNEGYDIEDIHKKVSFLFSHRDITLDDTKKVIGERVHKPRKENR